MISGFIATWMGIGLFIYMIALGYYAFKPDSGGPFHHVSTSPWYEGLFAVFFYILVWPVTLAILVKKVKNI